MPQQIEQAYQWLLKSEDFDARNLRNAINSAEGADCFDLRGTAKVLAKYHASRAEPVGEGRWMDETTREKKNSLILKADSLLHVVMDKEDLGLEEARAIAAEAHAAIHALAGILSDDPEIRKVAATETELGVGENRDFNSKFIGKWPDEQNVFERVGSEPLRLPSCHVCGEMMEPVCPKCGASTKPADRDLPTDDDLVSNNLQPAFPDAPEAEIQGGKVEELARILNDAFWRARGDEPPTLREQSDDSQKAWKAVAEAALQALPSRPAAQTSRQGCTHDYCAVPLGQDCPTCDPKPIFAPLLKSYTAEPREYWIPVTREDGQVIGFNRAEEKCTFTGCENRGVPQTGFNFYVCANCFGELDRALHAQARAKSGMETDNEV